MAGPGLPRAPVGRRAQTGSPVARRRNDRRVARPTTTQDRRFPTTRAGSRVRARPEPPAPRPGVCGTTRTARGRRVSWRTGSSKPAGAARRACRAVRPGLPPRRSRGRRGRRPRGQAAEEDRRQGDEAAAGRHVPYEEGHIAHAEEDPGESGERSAEGESGVLNAGFVLHSTQDGRTRYELDGGHSGNFATASGRAGSSGRQPRRTRSRSSNSSTLPGTVQQHTNHPTSTVQVTTDDNAC